MLRADFDMNAVDGKHPARHRLLAPHYRADERSQINADVVAFTNLHPAPPAHRAPSRFGPLGAKCLIQIDDEKQPPPILTTSIREKWHPLPVRPIRQLNSN